MSIGLITVIGILAVVAAVLIYLEFQERREISGEAEMQEAFNDAPKVELVPVAELMTVYNWEDDETVERVNQLNERIREAEKARKKLDREIKRWEKSNGKLHRDIRTGGLSKRRNLESHDSSGS